MNYSFSKAEKMYILELVHKNKEIPKKEKYDFILFDLIDDGLVVFNKDTSSVYITYFGFRELSDWDPILQVSVNNQLLTAPYGEA